MKLDSYYLHAFDNHNGYSFNGEKSLKKLEQILESGELKSKRLRGITDESYGGWNGLDYISLCDYRKRNNRPYENDEYLKDYTALEVYIKKSLSFLITRNKIQTIKTTLMFPIIFDWDSHFEMYRLGNSKDGRYSDLLDEVQVKDRISLSKVKGITIPIKYMITDHKSIIEEENKYYIKPYTTEEIIEYLNNIRDLLNFYKVSSKLYDIETQALLETEDDIEKTVKENIKIMNKN